MIFLLLVMLAVGIVLNVYFRTQGHRESVSLGSALIFVLAIYGLFCLIGAIV